MTKDITFRETRLGPGSARSSSRQQGLGFDGHRSWQRSSDQRGRYTGREYYDTRSTGLRTGASRATTTSGRLPAQPAATGRPRRSGRALVVAGTLLMLAGFAYWFWSVVALVAAARPGSTSANPFTAELAGLPMAPIALAAVIVGGVLVTVGSAVNRR